MDPTKCEYYKGGYCTKGLPGTLCSAEGCVSYYLRRESISLNALRDILGKCVEVGYINGYGRHRIMDLVREHIDKN